MIFGPKRPGHCLACGIETYDIRDRQVREDGSERLRVGAMLDSGTQIELLLSDGSAAHLDFCVDCAAQFGPDDYLSAWEAVLAATEASVHRQALRPNDRRQTLGHLQRLWPLAVLRWRRPDETGRLILDRRGPTRTGPNAGAGRPGDPRG